jgi:polysaccharide biosynthesis protein PslG
MNHRLRRFWSAGAVLLALLTFVVASLSAAPAAQAARYVAPQFFGQHLMYNWNLTPQVPVHAMRLWDSNTRWCEIDKGTATNRYDFGQLDALLGQASRLGADVQFTFGGTPAWAVNGSSPQSVADQCASTPTSNPWDPPTDDSSWTEFVTALVTHAKGRIRAYELWNEAEYQYFWSGSVEQLVRMSVQAAEIIHRIDPSAIVLSPSTSNNPTARAWLNQYLASLPAGTIDAVAVHTYTDGAWPEDAVPAQMSAVRAAIPAAYAGIPIWSTEGGWGHTSQFSTAASDRRAFVARYNLQLLTQGVQRSYWYAYQNSQWGTLWDGTALTPAGVATRTLDSWLAGATLADCSTANGNLWTCTLTTSAGKTARIVWAKTTQVNKYSTDGYRTVKTLDGRSSSAGSTITVTPEPVLLDDWAPEKTTDGQTPPSSSPVTSSASAPVAAPTATATAQPAPTPLSPKTTAAPCKVPVLKGLRLVRAKQRIRAAGCSVGRTTYRRSKARHGKVIITTPGRGRVLASGARVSLVVGRGARTVKHRARAVKAYSRELAAGLAAERATAE